MALPSLAAADANPSRIWLSRNNICGFVAFCFVCFLTPYAILRFAKMILQIYGSMKKFVCLRVPFPCLLTTGAQDAGILTESFHCQTNWNLAGRARSQCVTDAGRSSYILWAPRPQAVTKLEFVGQPQITENLVILSQAQRSRRILARNGLQRITQCVDPSTTLRIFLRYDCHRQSWNPKSLTLCSG